MTEFKEFIKNEPKVQNDISQTIEKYNKEPYATHSKIDQNFLIHSKDFEQAINRLGDTIENMDIKLEQKDKKN